MNKKYTHLQWKQIDLLQRRSHSDKRSSDEIERIVIIQFMKFNFNSLPFFCYMGKMTHNIEDITRWREDTSFILECKYNSPALKKRLFSLVSRNEKALIWNAQKALNCHILSWSVWFLWLCDNKAERSCPDKNNSRILIV